MTFSRNITNPRAQESGRSNARRAGARRSPLRGPRFVLVGSVVLVLVCLVPAAAREAPVSGPALRPAPRNLREIEERLDGLARRITKLIEAANQDPDEARIRLYEGYTEPELKKTRGRVRAEDLVRYMLDPAKNFKVRQHAWKALQAGAQFRGDPDLSKSEKQGTKSRRAWFCEKHLVKQLLNKDRLARKFVHDLLMVLWFGKRSGLPEIDRYNANDEKTWSPARKRWIRYLRKN